MEEWIERALDAEAQVYTLTVELDTLRAKIERARKVNEQHAHWRGDDYVDGWNFCLETVINILDGIE